MHGTKMLIVVMFNDNKGNGSFRAGLKDTEIKYAWKKEKKSPPGLVNSKGHVHFKHAFMHSVYPA